MLLCVAGRYQQGSHPVYGMYYIRWWFVYRQAAKARYAPYFLNAMGRTPFLCTYMRVLGARIGGGTYIDGMNIGSGISMMEPDLVYIGSHTMINAHAIVLTHQISDGVLHLKGVSVGSHCQIGSRALLMQGSAIGNNVSATVRTRGRLCKVSQSNQLSSCLLTNTEGLLWSLLLWITELTWPLMLPCVI